MKKIILILFTLMLSNTSFCQEKTNFEKYDELVRCAMLDFKHKNFKPALENFQRAFKIIPNDLDYDHFYAAAAALNINDDEEAKKLIIESIIQMNSPKYFFLNFEEFNPFRSQKIFNEISRSYDSYTKEFYKRIDHPEIYKEIDTLVKMDQEVRINGGNMNQVDTKNINRLIEITKQYGWQERGWIILWHQRGTYGQNNYVWLFFKPFIDDEIRKGKIRKDFWVRFDDEKSIDENKKQIFGSFWNQYEEYPIIDIKNIDKTRESVGLPPIWYQIEVSGIKPPKDYKITKDNKINCLDN